MPGSCKELVCAITIFSLLVTGGLTPFLWPYFKCSSICCNGTSLSSVMVLEHRCTKCNSTSCQHRTPLAVTISYSSEPLRTGLEYTPATCTTPTEAAEPSEGDFLSLKPLSYPQRQPGLRHGASVGTWRVTHLGCSRARRRGAPKALPWSWWRCLESAGCLLPRCSRDGPCRAACKYIQMQCLNCSTVT